MKQLIEHSEITAAEARTFTLATIIGATSAWDLAFNFGAYGTVFFTKIFFIWSASIALFGVSIFLPRHHSPITWWGRALLTLPTIWMILALFDNDQAGNTIQTFMEVVAIATFAFCLPYSLWLVSRITQPELFELNSQKSLIAITVIVMVVTLIGFAAGRYNYVLISCDDFEVAGAQTPDNCGNPEIDMDI